jgi:hypothetical protein
VAKARRFIRTTPDAAFIYLSDLTRHGEWAGNPGLEVVQTSPGAVMPGATFHSRGTQFGIKLEDELKVIDFQPPLRFAFESTGRGGVYRHIIDFEPADGGTIVTKEMRTIEGPKPFRLIKPVSEFYLSRRMAADLKRIARRLESPA